MTRTEFSDLEVIEESVLQLTSDAPRIQRVIEGARGDDRSSRTTVMLDLPENILGPASEPSANNRADGTVELRSAAQKIWKMCVETIRPQISSQTMRTWFEPLVATELEGSEITLWAPSNFFCEWITEHYQSILENSLKDVLGASARFRFDCEGEIESLNTKLEAAVPDPSLAAKPTERDRSAAPGEHRQSSQTFPANGVPPPVQSFAQHQQNLAQQQSANLQQSPPSQGFAPAIPSQRTALSPQGAPQSFAGGNAKRQAVDPSLNPRYTFDTFIRGESNKLAYAAAMAVANNPGGTRYNPLVIYGNVGLGKTHLIQAIGTAVVQKFSGARVLYTSSDRFTVEFVDAIQNDRINEFQSLYRSIDVLIIDDVQFFAGKEKTQDIFFHTFNALRELGKQIILTCDRPPKELKDIDDRLLNRLQWGLTADIGAPDLETRIAILRHKAIADGIELSSDVIEFIATNVTTNIRELEGCLISLLATASLEGKDPTVELAKDVLRKVAKRSAPILSIETIQKTVARKFGIEEELLRAKTRKQEIVQARQVAMYLAKELTNSSLKTIGLHFGGRDHSTVIHACQTIYDDIKHNQTLQVKVEELRRQFELMQ
jgi:chromosomal replication initiator protein